MLAILQNFDLLSCTNKLISEFSIVILTSVGLRAYSSVCAALIRFVELDLKYLSGDHIFSITIQVFFL